VAFAIAVALAGLAFVRYWPKRDAREPVRFTLATTGALNPMSVALSPDGRYIAYVTRLPGEPSRLYVRPIDALEARVMPGTEGAAGAFWSADSRHVGFAGQGQLKRIALVGGPPQTLASLGTAGLFGGATWNASGDILFSAGPGSSIKRVSASGGDPVDVTKLEGPMAGTAHVFPSFLPDGRRFLFARIATLAAGGQALYVGSLDSSPPAMVVQGASRGAYAAQGYLLFDRERAVIAQRFDPDRLLVSGEPIRVADGLTVGPSALIGAFSVSNTGVLSYVTGGSGTLAGPQVPLSRLTWYDRGGRAVGSIGEPGRYAGVSLSPDGRRVAVHRHEDEGGGIWIYDLQRNTWSQFTFDRAHNIAPLWSPDGQFVVFASLSRGNFYRKLASGSGAEEALLKSPDLAVAETWSPDGKTLLFARGGTDTWSLSLSDMKTAPLLDSPAAEFRAQISPDGRWIAYGLGELTRTDVYIRSYPSLAGPWRVSTQGGNNARWSPDGRELFYMSGGAIMAVDIQVNGDAISPGTPRPLFKVRTGLEVPGGAPYDISPDGQRLLVSEVVDQPATSQPAAVPSASPNIAVVLNWQEELKRLVPTR
jgi:Tol biopolymer transport system component